ncbi:uncharacterized protein BJ171DRAFT_500719 [Polychytrium aggregatum]|uniref:uncharacterized protein n=1 Tax=Polychytrium aggregatum TaxID=110093 RepID=UPI0022FE7F81|nr:uncharacterized protein BJ171DRAFT_500719 [Polychytrium aggregatum]KAI9205534.1 hypothetical protein BJ171DRAFT_500719 [Polychytrium aggregatum]
MRQSTRSFALSRRPSNRPLIYFSRTARIRPVGLLGPRPRMPFDINNRTARVPRTPPPLPFSGGNFQPYPLFERIDPATLPVTAVADEPSSYLSLGTLLAHPLPERSIDLPDTRTLDAWLHRCLEECSTEQLVHVAGLLMQSKHILEYRVKDKHLLGLLFERLYEAQGQGLGSDRIYGYAKFLHAQKLPLTERQVFYFLRLCERRYDHRQIIAVHSSWEQSHPESQLFVQIPAQRILMGAFATLGHFDAGYDYLSRLLDTGHVIDRSVSDRLFRACIFERNAAKVLQLWHWIAMNAVPVTSQAVVALMSTQDTRLSLKNLHAQAEEAYSSVPPWAWVERNPKFFLESIRMYTAKSRFKNAEAVLEDLWRTSTDRRLLIQGTVILINAYNRRAPLQSQPYKLFRRLARLDHSVRAPRVAAANVASVDTEDLSSVAADDASVGAANNVPPDSVITAGPSGADNTISDSSSSDASMLDAYAAILRWCRFNSKTGLAMYLYNQMIAKGLSPTLEIYATMMRCFAYLRDLPRAKAVIQEIDSRGHIPDRFTYSSILAVYARNRQLDKIGHICDEMRDRGVKFDADIYHVLLHAYAKCGRFKTVESLYQSLLQDGIVPTATTFANLIQGALHFKRQARALGWINEMARSNIEPSSSVLDVMIADRLDNNDFENAFSLLELMFNLDIVPTRTTYENFLTKLGRYDKLSRKQLQQQRSIHSELMSRLPENQKKSQKAQELLMVYHCRQQQYDRVFEVFRALEANGRRIGYHAYKAMIMSRHQTGDTDEMCRLLDLMVHDGWKPSIALFAKLIGDLSSDPRDFLAQFFVYQRIRQCQRYPTPQIYRRMLDSAAREKNYKALYQIYHDLLRTPHGFHRETVVYFFDVVVQSIIQPIINGDGLYSESSFRFLHRVVRLSRCNRIRYRWYHEPLLRLYDFAISEENKDAELVLKVWNLFISKNKYYQTLFQPPYGHTDIKLDYDYMMEILGLQFRSGSALSTYWESVIRGRYVSVLGPVTVDLWHRYFKLLSWLDMYDELLAIGTTGIRSLKGESLEAQMHLVEEVNRILRTRAKLDHRNELLKFWNLAK